METKETDPIEETNDITICIQGHGRILTDTHLSIDESKHCDILSFTGSIGKAGIMKKRCPPMDIPQTSLISEGIPNIPELHIDGAQLDVMAMVYIDHVYKNIDNNPDYNTTEKSDISFAIIEQNMFRIYQACGVTEFPFFKRIKRPIETPPFIIDPPLHDKSYQLHPVSHEDCRNPKECSINGCELLDKSEQFCPYYGMIVVYSTNQEDNQHTLTGINSKDSLIANLNSEESHDEGNTDFWRNKIIQRWDNIIGSVTNEDERKGLEDEKQRILRLYDKMTLVLTSYCTTSDKMVMDEPLPNILLSEIIQIFHKGMGYDKINIIDPTCDQCDKISCLKVVVNKVCGAVRARRSAKIRAPNKYQKRKGHFMGKNGDIIVRVDPRNTRITLGGKRKTKNRKKIKMRTRKQTKGRKQTKRRKYIK